MLTSRTLAYQILLHLEQKASHPDRLIRTALERHSMLDERDRALLTELVYGTVRWQGRLDWHIDQLSRTRPDKIAQPVRVLLRLALYQILFLDRVPDHAAVNDTVNIAKSSQPPHVIRFINAILREAARRGDSWNWPNWETDPAVYTAIIYSQPVWLVRKLIDQIGAEETRLFCESNNRIAPAVFRVNTWRATRAEVIKSLKDEGIDSAPSPWLEQAVRVSSPRRDMATTIAYRKGWIQPQDEASQIISHLLAPSAGERVLDLCCGMGVKATHIAGLMNNEGQVLSVDKSAWKLEELQRNAQRQGIATITTLSEDILALRPESIGLFDRILLDAPCTGFGAVRRKPDIKWRRHIKDPYRLSQVQKELLLHAARFLKTGGVLVYATCTVLREEDEMVAQYLMDSSPNLSFEPAAEKLPDRCVEMISGPYFRSWPHKHDMDGFFSARWRKR